MFVFNCSNRLYVWLLGIFFFKQKTAYEMRISDWSSDVCSSDLSGDNRLSKEELKYGLADYGIQLNLNELEAAFSYFDRNRDGHIDLNEFMRGVRGEMNPRRRQLVLQAFDILDTNRSGTITVEEIQDRYDVSMMPEVRAGKMTPAQAMGQYLAQ